MNEQRVLSVSALARQARLVLEERFQTLWVEGEISNFRRPGSGHWYFTLKDDSAQIRCAFFAGRNRAVRFPVADGLQVVLRGKLSLYEGRGDFQIIVEGMEPAGEGALRAAFEALKRRLDAEGLFAAERKRPLPALPRRLAVISSATGAALRDVLSVVRRRYPALEVVLLPVTVQGDSAGPEIVAALARAPELEPDVVLLTRGGGSLEDLWAFNLEPVARAIAACPVPVVSAVGHETDFTIADYSADVRAPTPSAAAELITPDGTALAGQFQTGRDRLSRALITELRHAAQRLQGLSARLVDPRRRLAEQMQRTDDFAERLARAWLGQQRRQRLALAGLQAQLLAQRPEQRVRQSEQRTADCAGRLQRAFTGKRRQLGESLAATARTLHAISPLQTLERGYAIVTAAETALTSVDQATIGDQLTTYLKDGALNVEVRTIEHGRSPVSK